MPMHLEISVTGADTTLRKLEHIVLAAEDYTPVWQEVKQRFSSWEENWFAGEGNGTWPGLSRDYAHWKAKHFPGEPLLVATHDLKDSLLDPSVSDMDAFSFSFGTDDPKAHYHQEGGGNLPQRKVIDVGDDEIDSWMVLISEHLMGSE